MSPRTGCLRKSMMMSPKSRADKPLFSGDIAIFWRHWHFMETFFSDIMETFITCMVDFLWISDQNSRWRCTYQWISYSCCAGSFQTSTRHPINYSHTVSVKMNENLTSQINWIFRRHRIHSEKHQGWKKKYLTELEIWFQRGLKKIVWEKSIGARSYTTKRQVKKKMHLFFHYVIVVRNGPLSRVRRP